MFVCPNRPIQALALPSLVLSSAHRLITPVPKPRKRKGKQPLLDLGDAAGLSSIEQEYNPTPIINEIRSHLATWRRLPNPADWGVTPATARLLTHWRSHRFESVRPFFKSKGIPRMSAYSTLNRPSSRQSPWSRGRRRRSRLCVSRR